MARVGILALQGCCRPHEKMFRRLGIETVRVVDAEHLAGIDGLVLPGGESTTMLKTIDEELWQGLGRFARRRPMWGICAGCILMAGSVRNPPQSCLGILSMAVMRNAYGAQNESFITRLPVDLSPPRSVEAVFIRAPQIIDVGAGVRVLARAGGRPVLVEQGLHLAGTFHPELTADQALHRYFLHKITSSTAVAEA